jgi:hypothetical protein
MKMDIAISLQRNSVLSLKVRFSPRRTPSNLKNLCFFVRFSSVNSVDRINKNRLLGVPIHYY